MVISPRISEKSYALSRRNIYVFDVPVGANKAEVIRELAREYPDLEVADVRLMVAKGKVKATNRGKRARPGETRHSDGKKAYVTVTKGELDVFKDLAKDREEK